MRFLHKYTGILILISVCLPIASYVLWSESQEVFFEDWSCNDIVRFLGSTLSESGQELTPRENIRLQEIVAECVKQPFSPDP